MIISQLELGPLVVLLDMLDTYSKIICRLYDGARQYLASRNRKSHNFDEFFVETSLLFVSNVSTARHTMFCFGRMAVLPSKFRCFPVNDKFNSFGNGAWLWEMLIGKQIEKGFFRLEIRVFVVYVRILSQFMRGSSQFKHYFFWLQIDNT